MAHQLHAIAATALVPGSEPEQGRPFLRGKATLGKFVLFKNASRSLFFNLDLRVHTPALSTSCALLRPPASKSIRLLTQVHNRLDRYEHWTQASSYQVPKPAVLRQTRKPLLLIRLAHGGL